MSRQRWRRGDSRERLLQAALRAVAQVGPAAVSGRAVARTAEVHHAQVQQMFGSVGQLVTVAILTERDRYIAAVLDDPGGLPDPLAGTEFPLFWRALTQVVLDPGPIDLRLVAEGGPIALVTERLRGAYPDRDPVVNAATAVAWAAAPLGALVFEVPLRRGFGLDSDGWTMCWNRMGDRLRAMAEHSFGNSNHSPARAPTETPHLERAVSGRDRLVAAAEDLLVTRLETGVAGRDLAAHAGVNYGLVSHYFDSKVAIFDEALLNLHQRFLDDVLLAGDRTSEHSIPAVIVRHRPFLRAWASRLLGERPVPDFKLLGMQRLIAELISARGIDATNRSQALEATGDALAAVSLQLGWTLLHPLPLAIDGERLEPITTQLDSVHHWLLHDPRR